MGFVARLSFIGIAYVTSALVSCVLVPIFIVHHGKFIRVWYIKMGLVFV